MHCNFKQALLRAARFSIILGAALFAPVASLHPQSPAFYLHDGDTVVFYGDSITEQRYYTQWVAMYVATRFPHMRVRFFNEGFGGDRVSGGAAGPIDQRLTRDLFPDKPTVVTIMLGMNDGSYTHLTPEIESRYTQGYEHILAAIQQKLPDVRMTLFGPSPYDEVTRPEMFPGGYNGTLTHFSDLVHVIAAKHNAAFIDLNAPFVAALKKGTVINPLATELLVPDRVHPEPLAHWFMADAILKGWNAPGIVSSVTLDAASHSVTNTQNAQVTALTGDAASLSWTELDGALPLPIDDKNAGIHFLRQLIDLENDLDQQPLVITGLKPGSYQLNIDSHSAGVFTDADLAKGINLALLNTPMRGQASTVGWEVRDLESTHFVRMRMFEAQVKAGYTPEPGASDLMKFEQYQQNRIYELNQPKPHLFELRPVTAAQ